MRTVLFVITFLFAVNSSLLSQTPEKIDLAPIKVLVTNFDDVPQKGEQIIFKGMKSKKVYKGISDSEGKLDISLEGGEIYLIKIKSVGKADDYNKIEIPLLGKNESYQTILLTVQFELPRSFTLDNVEFDSGKSTLTKASYSELKELFEYLSLKEDVKIEIAGHTDDVGDDASNLKLSKERAQAVRNYLISKGITPTRVIAKGYGESQPIAYNDTPDGRQKNRRTEVRFITN